MVRNMGSLWSREAHHYRSRRTGGKEPRRVVQAPAEEDRVLYRHVRARYSALDMRVLLIYPSIDCPPGINHGVAALSGCLKADGHEVDLIGVLRDDGEAPQGGGPGGSVTTRTRIWASTGRSATRPRPFPASGEAGELPELEMLAVIPVQTTCPI